MMTNFKSSEYTKHLLDIQKRSSLLRNVSDTKVGFPKMSNTDLADHEFVTVVVASQVGEDPGSTRHDIDVITAKQLDQRPKQTLHSLLITAEDEEP